MNKSFTELFGGGGASGGIGGWFMPLLASKTVTITRNGKLRMFLQMSGGGGGAGSNAAGQSMTGGNSGPWGVLTLDVVAGDVFVFTLGAGGVKGAANSNGSAGSSTTVTRNGVNIITGGGGEGGVYATGAGTINTAVPSATITGMDFVVTGIRAGSAQNNGSQIAASGGAASDILQTGRGRSPNANGSGVRGGSIAVDTGIPLYRWLALVEMGWATGNLVYGDPGVGGNTTPGEIAGPFGGGGSGPSTATDASNGGYGGGGGGGTGTNGAGNGGAALGALTFAPTE